MLDLAIETRELTRRFGAHAAVSNIDLAVPRGSVFGFLGPNGSGKTTTIRMLLGLVQPTTGESLVLGEHMPRAWRSVLPRVGALVEGPAFAPYLSGAANLMRLDAADRDGDRRSRRTRVETALGRVGLTHAAGKPVKAYSLGMKQRLGLANAMLRPRELLILDEPTNGLDPQGTREVRSLIRSFAADGTTVFVSSHLLAEIEQLCSHAAVMSAGAIVAQGTLDELRGPDATTVTVRTPDVEQAVRVLRSAGLEPTVAAVAAAAGSAPAAAAEGLISAALHLSATDTDALVAALVTAGVRVRGFALDEPTLEDRFVALTGEGFDVVA